MTKKAQTPIRVLIIVRLSVCLCVRRQSSQRDERVRKIFFFLKIYFCRRLFPNTSYEYIFYDLLDYILILKF